MPFIPTTWEIILIFAPLAAGVAFLTTHNKYFRRYSNKKRPLRPAGEAAVVTFLFLVGLPAMAGFLLMRNAGPDRTQGVGRSPTHRKRGARGQNERLSGQNRIGDAAVGEHQHVGRAELVFRVLHGALH
jgi:hypothetical protein